MENGNKGSATVILFNKKMGASILLSSLFIITLPGMSRKDFGEKSRFLQKYAFLIQGH
jgi:hypothetical protein